MEGSAAVEIWKRSVFKNQFVYTTSVGDGDSSFFKIRFKFDPYGGIETIRKEECIGHVQKRLKKHLNKKSKSFPKLTASKVERVGQLFALVVVQNTCRSPSEIHLALLTVLEHLVERHENSPFSLDLRFYFQKTRAQNAEYPLIASPSLRQPYLTAPEYSHAKEIFDIFASISMRSALTMDQKKNANESLHLIIRHNSPKTKYLGQKSIVASTDIAVTTFHVGYLAIASVLELMSISCSHSTLLHLTRRAKLEIKIERELFWRPRKGEG